jgi:hypothetical protein
MRVVVAVPPGGSDAAHLALTAEGVDHEARHCAGDTGYGQLIVDLWAAGEGFVMVEHDVAPWMGAIEQLADCPNDWCQFRYPKHGGSLTRGLGCTKFSDRLVAGYPGLSVDWSATDWRVLDGAVGAAVADALKAEDPDRHPLCTHEPPVAHVRRLEE